MLVLAAIAFFAVAVKASLLPLTITLATLS